ncbi:MAG: DinB family protein [Candidatus Eisenbacteria bacterium]
MPMIDSFLQELEMEVPATRRLIERLPEDKFGWPHEKAYSLGQLALHVATTPGNVAQMSLKDMTEPPNFQQPAAETRAQLLDALEKSIATAKQSLAGMDDAKLQSMWKFVRDGKTMMEIPRAGVLRMIMLNHRYHHRGQLSTYLRSLGVAVPSVYGPTADENPFA